MRNTFEPDNSTSTISISTPTYSSFNDDFCYTIDNAVPEPGEIFVIRERGYGKIITLKDGNLQLNSNINRVGGCYWICVEKNGWLGFRNYISGTYIGHNGNGKFYAQATYHNDWESFCAREHPNEGYQLLTRHGSKLRKMDIKKSSDELNELDELVEIDTGGTTWEFAKVDRGLVKNERSSDSSRDSFGAQAEQSLFSLADFFTGLMAKKSKQAK
ncbi:hypothetical protein QC760_010540 [Botrytis cinerea]